MQLRLAGEGDLGGSGIPPGDLYVYVMVRPHSVFERDGSDIYCEIPVGFADAALGAEIEVSTLGGRASLRIPEGTQTGTVFRLRGKGLPEYRGQGKGDQMVRVIVRTPTNLTDKQRRILSELRKEDGSVRR
jgi:molecular chaperone DnaJ